MKVTDALPDGTSVFLDSAPLIYYVESVSPFFDIVSGIFQRIDDGKLTAVTSPITLAECLIDPLRTKNRDLERLFVDLISAGPHTTILSIDLMTARSAAEMRANYNLSLTDAIQFAVALKANCDVFLTNDIRLARVTEITVRLLSQLT